MASNIDEVGGYRTIGRGEIAVGEWYQMVAEGRHPKIELLVKPDNLDDFIRKYPGPGKVYRHGYGPNTSASIYIWRDKIDEFFREQAKNEKNHETVMRLVQEERWVSFVSRAGR